MTLTSRLREQAAAAGAVGSGVCRAEPFADVAESLRDRRASGSSAGMAFTFKAPDVSTDVAASFPWATHLFVVACSYLPEAGTPGSVAGAGRVARFAVRNFYTDLIDVLRIVAAEIRRAGYRGEWLCDDNRLVDRAAAVRAGVGWWGKNTMVLTPRYGPWILLGSVATDAPLEASKPMARGCGTCAACMPACPTGALIEPGILDARLCLAYWLQAPGVIPPNIRAAVGDRVYGCDDCLEACPPGSRLLEESTGRAGSLDLVGMLGSDDDTLMTTYGHFYIPDRQARYLRRNALVALGNTGEGSEALAVLAGYSGHPDWLLRAHAAWALGRFGGGDAAAVLNAARRGEGDERVLEEISEALRASLGG